ncbi:hypothetical protein B0H13DRAFT_1906414 [Mycena leptocephala]|nr:hypothetical protein B0H13DRAFT_1906414 [Mycena leptocephala]
MSHLLSTPSQPLKFIPFSASPSPLGRKRARLDSSPVSSVPTTPSRQSRPALPHSPYRFNSNNEVVDNPLLPSSDPVLPLSVIAPSLPTPSTSLDSDSRMKQALAALEAKSHVIRQGVAAEEQSDKETGATYARQVRNYQMWWEASQAALLIAEPSHIVIPAFPIIPAKVTVFLEYETTRPQVSCLKRKRDDGSESTGTIGVSGVKQVISALEYWRHHHQHEYPDVPVAQIGLRHDLRIKTFETAAAHKEPQRVKMAHTLKAKGTNADHYYQIHLPLLIS